MRPRRWDRYDETDLWDLLCAHGPTKVLERIVKMCADVAATSDYEATAKARDDARTFPEKYAVKK